MILLAARWCILFVNQLAITDGQNVIVVQWDNATLKAGNPPKGEMPYMKWLTEKTKVE